MTLAAPSLYVIVVSASGQAAPESSQLDREREARLRFLTRRAAEFSLRDESEPDESLPLSVDPVLRYTNPERDRGSYDGATFLWLDEALPRRERLRPELADRLRELLDAPEG